MNLGLSGAMLGLALLIAMPASAPAAEPLVELAQAGKARISLAEATELAQKATGGRVLDAQPSQGGYRIKVLTPQGEVRVLFVDSQAGTIR